MEMIPMDQRISIVIRRLQRIGSYANEGVVPAPKWKSANTPLTDHRKCQTGMSYICAVAAQ